MLGVCLSKMQSLLVVREVWRLNLKLLYPQLLRKKRVKKKEENIRLVKNLYVFLIRYWCVLRDGCLHCYFTPQSDKKRDAVPLLGYDVIANVKNLNRARFIFHLQQQVSKVTFTVVRC